MNLAAFFDARTRDNSLVAFTADDGVTVTGHIVRGDENVPASWVRDAFGNLFSQQGRAYDVQRRYPLPEIQSLARVVDVPFVVSATRNARVSYPILLPSKLLLIGTDVATVALIVDGVEVSRVSNKMILGVGLSINDERQPEHILSGFVRAGQTVLIATIEASANAAAPSVGTPQEVLE